MKKKKLIIYGVGALAEMAHAYFTKDSEYMVVAFTIEQSYFKEDQMLGLPVYTFDSIEHHIKPGEADMFMAIGPLRQNMVLEIYCAQAKAKGYKLASYCASLIKQHFEPAHGDNCFFDHATRFHPFVKTGHGVYMIGSGIGHHVEIGDYTFLSVATLGGHVIVEDHVFIGMGAIIKEGVRIGKGSIIGMGCLITKDVLPYSVYNVPGTRARANGNARRVELFKRR